jgi:hypothetical protein
MVHVDYTAVLYPSLPSVSVLAIEYNQLWEKLKNL